ncbi:31964_t:CDS:1, partial [Racocetra persica]
KVRVDESTIIRILQKSKKILSTDITRPDTKHHKSVIIPELELVLKKFILIYQSKAILNKTILVERTKQLAEGLDVLDRILKFSAR